MRGWKGASRGRHEIFGSQGRFFFATVPFAAHRLLSALARAPYGSMERVDAQ